MSDEISVRGVKAKVGDRIIARFKIGEKGDPTSVCDDKKIILIDKTSALRDQIRDAIVKYGAVEVDAIVEKIAEKYVIVAPLRFRPVPKKTKPIKLTETVSARVIVAGDEVILQTLSTSKIPKTLLEAARKALRKHKQISLNDNNKMLVRAAIALACLGEGEIRDGNIVLKEEG